MKLTVMLFGWCSICFLVSLSGAQVYLVPQPIAQLYTVADIGTLGGPSSWANGVNDLGEVVGYSCVDAGCNILHAFEWNHKQGMRDLGTLMGGGSYSIATAINDQEQVAGSSDFSQPFNGNTHAVLWTAETTTLEDLGALGCPDINAANGISFLGQIVGTSTIEPCAGGGQDRAFLWTSGRGMEDLGTLGGGTFSFGNGVNLFGQAVGYSDCASCSSYHAFLWAPQSGMSDLGTLRGGIQSSAAAINNFGVIVGTSDFGDPGLPTRAFLWTKRTKMRNLGTLPGGAFSSANAVSDFGQVVGISDAQICSSHRFSRLRNGRVVSDASHAFTWSDLRGMQDLNKLIPENSGWVLISAESVNFFGQIAGWGTHHGETRAFLLTPAGLVHRMKQF